MYSNRQYFPKFQETLTFSQPKKAVIQWFLFLLNEISIRSAYTNNNYCHPLILFWSFCIYFNLKSH